MVNAELIHNPYLLVTSAQFNGRAPKINSAIERFMGRPLVEWAGVVPQVFRDELNGLDFDLSFTGTDADYQRILNAFSDQGISVLDESSDVANTTSIIGLSKYDVRLTHKSGFESVGEKKQEIWDFVIWLNSHRNRWFDYDEFIGRNKDALDGSVPFIVVNESPIQLELSSVSVETVDSAVRDLEGTKLTNTPILFMVNPRNRAQFRKELVYVLGRADVRQDQLFFLIHPTMNREMVVRVISDLGVDEPQVVDEPDDNIVLEYLDDFPSMEYVRNSIRIFRTIFDEVGDILEKVGAETAVTSANRGEMIVELDSEIAGLRRIRAVINNTKPLEDRRKLSDIYQQFENQVMTWRNRKTGVTGHNRIVDAAHDYVFFLLDSVRMLEADVVNSLQSEQHGMERTLSNHYKSAIAASAFSPSVDPPRFQSKVVFPDLIDALISQTGTERVAPKNDFFGLFGSGGHESEPEKVEVASFDVWRFTARGMLMPAVQEMVDTCCRELSNYHAAVVEAYSHQIDSLIDSLLEEKELATAMLSDEERLLEEDKDWLSEFEERLHAIEWN